MDFNEPACWIYENAGIDWLKVQKYGIGTIYIDPRSTNAVQVIDEIRRRNRRPGIYTVPVWLPEMTGADFAHWTSQQLQRLLPRLNAPEAAPYMADLEARSISWQAEFFRTYRSYQPARPSSYTNEPFKDGTAVPIPALLAAKFHWYPQLYYGDMRPADAAAVVLEIMRWGVSAEIVHPMYDGAALPGDHRDGCFYTLERLP